jgi:hypothetical protein
MVKMSLRGEVRIPPNRLLLLWMFCVSFFGVLGFSWFVSGMLPTIGQQPSILQMVGLSFIMLCCIISLPYLALIALWAFVRLVFNLPGVILTPEGIINHSTVYHVVIPWREIDQLVRNVALGPPSSSLGKRGQRKLLDADIIVLEHDKRRLHEQQQPLTRALLWLCKSLAPINIDTKFLAWSQKEVWTQLERYVRETVGNTSIKFITIGSKSSARS